MKKSAPKRLSKKAPKPLDVHTNDDVKRYIGAVTEHFEGHVSAVAEQFVGLNDKIDAFSERVDERFAVVEEKLDSHTQAIGNLSEDVEIIKTNVEFLKSALQAKVDYQDFSALEKRVRLVEEKLHRS